MSLVYFHTQSGYARLRISLVYNHIHTQTSIGYAIIAGECPLAPEF